MPCKEIDKDRLLKGEMSPGVALLLFLAVFPASLNGFLVLCSVVFLGVLSGLIQQRWTAGALPFLARLNSVTDFCPWMTLLKVLCHQNFFDRGRSKLQMMHLMMAPRASW